MRTFACFGFCLLACFTSSASAELVNVLVPAYANPCCDGGPNMWSNLIATAADSSRNFQLRAIFNPNSGPGTSRDFNFVDAAGQGPLKNFRDAGGIIDGYVATGYGNKAIELVKVEVASYFTGFYGGFVDGIFFDEMSNDLADVGYYQELNGYVQSLSPGAHTFGNPGTTFTNNLSGQTTFSSSDYVNSLDTIITFEDSAANYANDYTSFNYLENLEPNKISHIVHSLASWDSSLIQTASNRGAGYLYVTDDVMGLDNNPYDTLASYWPQFAADVSSFNAASVPEPSSIVLVSFAGLIMMYRRKRLAVCKS